MRFYVDIEYKQDDLLISEGWDIEAHNASHFFRKLNAVLDAKRIWLENINRLNILNIEGE